jgi:hypothetical protein
MATQNIYSLTDVWNAGGTTFKGIALDVTDTASASGSLLMDLQVGAASKFKVGKTGTSSTAPAVSVQDATLWSPSSGTWAFGSVGNAESFRFEGGLTGAGMPNSALLWWSSGATGAYSQRDVILCRNAAASLRMGMPDAASPVAQTFGVQGSRAGTDSNVGGANFTLRSGSGTGTGTLSTLILQSPVTVASGTDAQTQATGLTIKAGTAVMTSYTVATLPAAATAGAGARAFVTDALAPVFGSAVAGSGAVGVPVYSTGAAWNVG